MTLSLNDCTFSGPALPEPFVRFELEQHLQKAGLLPPVSSRGGKIVEERWETMRRKLRLLGEQGGPTRVANHVLEPLRERLGYSSLERSDPVSTREGDEDGGWLLLAEEHTLRAWAFDFGTDLDAPSRRGRAYRFSPARIADRVLRARNERLALLTDGQELRVMICDPAQRESQLIVRLDRADGWQSSKSVPDSYRLVLALAAPKALAGIGELTEKARLSQVQVTKDLRQQAKRAVTEFVQGLLDERENAARLATVAPEELPGILWREALIVVYRLLFILKLESSPDLTQAFSFASNSLWRNTYSPNTALGAIVRDLQKGGGHTGSLLAGGLRALFRLFEHGLRSSELRVTPLDGMLFGPSSAQLIESLAWSEHAVARLLGNLLWTEGRKGTERQRVHYGALDVEDLGRVYEALLELEPGIASEPMCRLRRQKLEVVLPSIKGSHYRSSSGHQVDSDDADAGEDIDEEEEEEGTKRGKSKVQWIEEIRKNQFFVRAGLGRKSTGAYYTPHPLVRFLVRETLGPQVEGRSPRQDPMPQRILALKVLDPAMGSGHFLVEACRFLGDHLYEACRLCDEQASAAEDSAERAKSAEVRDGHLERARSLRQRIEDLPVPNDELVAYLPSRSAAETESALSEAKARALCRRLIAVHSLYGVDKNPLAVELAKVSLWLESHAEGLPLTFLDHRLICGDSLTGPFFEQLLTYPGSGDSLEGSTRCRVREMLRATLHKALEHVRELEESVGKDVPDIERKYAARHHLDRSLEALRLLGRAWTGGVMLGPDFCDDAGYEALMRATAAGSTITADQPQFARVLLMAEEAGPALSYDLAFPEVFFPGGTIDDRGGFDAVLGNPPWDALQPYRKEFYASFDLRVLDAPTRKERSQVEQRLAADESISRQFDEYVDRIERMRRALSRIHSHIGKQADGAASGAATDVWQGFAQQNLALLKEQGRIGTVLPSAFHANQSATGIRTLYLKEKARLLSCFCFENRKKLFEIHSSFKFATIVAERGATGADAAFECAFYLHDLEWLFENHPRLKFTTEFVAATGGDYLTFLELRGQRDVDVAATCYRGALFCGAVRESRMIKPGEEMHMSKASNRFTSAGALDWPESRDPEVAETLRARGYVPLHEGKTFHQYTDNWEDPPRYLVALQDVADKPAWIEASRHYRLAFRDVASSTNERTGIFCVLPPGVLCGNKAPCERKPQERPNVNSLLFLAIGNCYAFDFILRLKVAATVNLFILDGCPVPPGTFEEPLARFLAHTALRLTCNHTGYAPLWKEQLGKEWREESGKRPTWPVLSGDEQRWLARAAVDALVANAYGLSRHQYEHVLASFNHRSYPKAQQLCLTAFDELQKVGPKAFCRKHDPYWDIPVVTALAKPVISYDLQLAALNEKAAPSNDTEPPARGRGRGPSVKRAVPPAASQRSAKGKGGK